MTLAAETAETAEDARRAHYADFYGRRAVGEGRVLAIVHGNCQAESLRVVLGGETLATIRVPPVHELGPADLPHLRRWLMRAGVLVSQPIRDGYRGLPLGTAQALRSAGAGTRLIVVPIVRYAGLYPEQAIIRPAHDPAAVPPLVPYHSLRTLARAAGYPPGPPLDVDAARRVANASLDELRRRERAHGAVAVSDLLVAPSFSLMRTINHPGNPVWLALAARVRRALGISEPVRDPDRPLLAGLHAPRDAAVIRAFGLEDEADPDWHAGELTISAAEVQEAHLEWYARQPETVTAGLLRHAATLAALGLT
jgi:hypothetical protein